MAEYNDIIRNKSGRYFLITDAGETVAAIRLDNQNPNATVYLENREAFSDQTELGTLFRRVIAHYGQLLYSLDKIAEIDEEKAKQVMYMLGILLPED